MSAGAGGAAAGLRGGAGRLGPPPAPLSPAPAPGHPAPPGSAASRRGLGAGGWAPAASHRSGWRRPQVLLLSFVVCLNRNGAPKSRLDKMWQRVFFCLQSINTTFKVRGEGREKSNKYNLKMAVSQIFENIPQTLSHHLCGAVGSLGQASAIPRLHPAGMASSLERPQIFLL